MKRERLSRTDSRDLSQRPGVLAERLARDAYGYAAATASEDFDGIRESGAVCEIKSAASELSGGQAGRFRLWEKQHSRLVRRDRNGIARYIFVVFDVSQKPPVAKMLQKRPAKIGNIVAGRGGFGPSGHSSKGDQHKLPIEAVF